MNLVDRYIHDVMVCVFAAAEERERFEADLRAHFADALEGGESAVGIIADMGKPGDVAAAFNAERQIQYAGFWRRLVAFVGDVGVILALALIPFAMTLMSVQHLQLEGSPSVWVVLRLAMSAITVLGVILFYFPLLEWRFGKTAGKHFMRIRVVRESGAPIGLGQAFVRRLSYYFEMFWVDALFIPFTDKKQRALDIIAKTIVAREPGEDPAWWGWAICLLLPAACLLAMFGVLLIWPQG
jgi:uncharacterized RDD family membrane protein YckC